MQKSITIIICMFFFSACEDFPLAGDRALSVWVNNKSSIPVNCIFSRTYPDTSLPEKQNKLAYAKPGTEVHFEFSDDNYDKLFKSLPADTLSIFIISSDTLTKYGWE